MKVQHFDNPDSLRFMTTLRFFVSEGSRIGIHWDTGNISFFANGGRVSIAMGHATISYGSDADRKDIQWHTFTPEESRNDANAYVRMYPDVENDKEYNEYNGGTVTEQVFAALADLFKFDSDWMTTVNRNRVTRQG